MNPTTGVEKEDPAEGNKDGGGTEESASTTTMEPPEIGAKSNPETGNQDGDYHLQEEQDKDEGELSIVENDGEDDNHLNGSGSDGDGGDNGGVETESVCSNDSTADTIVLGVPVSKDGGGGGGGSPVAGAPGFDEDTEEDVNVDEYTDDDEDGDNEGSGGGSSSSSEDDTERRHFSWTIYLNRNPQMNFVAAPVDCFNVFMDESWNALVQTGVYVEYETGEVGNEKAYWIARVQELQGYLVRVLPLGARIPEDESGKKLVTRESPYIWLNLLTDCTRVGVRATRTGGFLSPPIEPVDWKNLLLTHLNGEASISGHIDKYFEEHTKKTLRVGMEFEVHDTHNISQYKVATLKKTAGDRYYFKYWDDTTELDENTNPVNDQGFWCSSKSGLFRPKGWCKKIGIKLSAPPKYNAKAPARCFLETYDPDCEVEVGSKLECVDPVQPIQICAATVIEVLKDGFILVRFDHSDDDFDPNIPNNDSMYVHVTSKMIFECGFAQTNGIELIPPKEYKKKKFSWNEYLATTNQKPIKLSKRPELQMTFEVNHRLEAVDQVESGLVCTAIIRDIRGRLLRIHFDGWSDDYDQWMDIESCDIYPVGWCESVGYPVSGPNGGKLSRNKRILPNVRAEDPNAAYPIRSRMPPVVVNQTVPGKTRTTRSSATIVTCPPPVPVTPVVKRKKNDSVGPAKAVETPTRKASQVLQPQSSTAGAKKQGGRGRNAKTTTPTPPDESLRVTLVSHEEVKAEAIMLGKSRTSGSREEVKAALEKLKFKPPPPKKKKTE